MNMNHQRSFGIWGESKSGKSSYLIAVYSEFQRIYRKNGNKGWHIQVDDPETINYLEKHLGRFSEGVFPQPTDKTTPQMLEFRLRNQREASVFRIMEAAGQHLDEQFDDDNYYQMLVTGCGILMMFDAMKNKPEDRRNTGKRLHRLREYMLDLSPNHRIILALCITKLDLHPDWQRIDRNPRHYLKESLIEKNDYENLIRLFQNPNPHDADDVCAISVAGKLDNNQWNIKQTKNAEGVSHSIPDMKHWQPHNLLKPLFYLLRNA